MATIKCRIDTVYIREPDGSMEEGLRAICPLCHHETKNWGRGEGSVLGCLSKMKHQCPRQDQEGHEKNDYVGEL